MNAQAVTYRYECVECGLTARMPKYAARLLGHCPGCRQVTDFAPVHAPVGLLGTDGLAPGLGREMDDQANAELG